MDQHRYEVINTALQAVELPDTGRGAITGALFTTITLPLGNYRFCQSMNPPIPVTREKLWMAYAPTLLRDVLYGNCGIAFEKKSLFMSWPWLFSSKLNTAV
jgi:hypothetical protein